MTIEAWDYGGSGLEKTEYSFDDTDWNTYSIPLTFTDMGTTTVYYRSIDNAGNIEEVHNQTHYVDDTPPLTFIRGTCFKPGGYDIFPYRMPIKIFLHAFDPGDNESAVGVENIAFSRFISTLGRDTTFLDEYYASRPPEAWSFYIAVNR